MFTPLLSGAEARRFGKQIIAEFGLPEMIKLYPKQDRLVTGPGSLMRLPLGVHRKSQRRYHFVTADGDLLAPTIREQIAMLSKPERVPRAYVDRLLAQRPETDPVSPTPSFPRLSSVDLDRPSDWIKARVSVLEFASWHVELDQRGRGYCPFHNDRVKSFSVNDASNYWHCFANCGGGSVIDFWMKWRASHGQDGSFAAAVRDLRQMLN